MSFLSLNFFCFYKYFQLLICHIAVINCGGLNLTLILQKDKQYLHGCKMQKKLCNWKLLLPEHICVTEEKLRTLYKLELKF